MGSSVKKLNLGCGKKLLPGYINIDLYGNPDIVSDIKALPFKDEDVDEILAVHVFEHFYLKEVPDVLKEWKRVLKPGGMLVLELPCFNKVAQWLQVQPLKPQMTMWAMYGDPSTHHSEADLHKWLWSVEQITDCLSFHKFESIRYEDPCYHVKDRDMRITAINGTLL